MRGSLVWNRVAWTLSRILQYSAQPPAVFILANPILSHFNRYVLSMNHTDMFRGLSMALNLFDDHDQCGKKCSILLTM